MAIHDLGETLDDQVGPVFERPADDRAGESVVDDQHRVGAAGDLSQRGDIAYPEGWITDCLGEQQARLAGHLVFHRLQVAGIDHAGMNAQPLGLRSQQPLAAAVKLIGNEDAIARSQLGKHDGGQGRHSGAADGRARSAVQHAAFFGQQIGIGMPIAAVGVAGLLARQEGLGLLGVADPINAGEMNWFAERLGGTERQRGGLGTNIIGLHTHVPCASWFLFALSQLIFTTRQRDASHLR